METILVPVYSSLDVPISMIHCRCGMDDMESAAQPRRDWFQSVQSAMSLKSDGIKTGKEGKRQKLQ